MYDFHADITIYYILGSCKIYYRHHLESFYLSRSCLKIFIDISDETNTSSQPATADRDEASSSPDETSRSPEVTVSTPDISRGATPDSSPQEANENGALDGETKSANPEGNVDNRGIIRFDADVYMNPDEVLNDTGKNMFSFKC